MGSSFVPATPLFLQLGSTLLFKVLAGMAPPISVAGQGFPGLVVNVIALQSSLQDITVLLPISSSPKKRALGILVSAILEM